MGGSERTRLLGCFKQLLQLGGRQDVVDLNRHPDWNRLFTDHACPNPLLDDDPAECTVTGVMSSSESSPRSRPSPSTGCVGGNIRRGSWAVTGFGACSEATGAAGAVAESCAREFKKFAEPVSLSSTALADFPLPGTALELGFGLLGLRARRKSQPRGWARPVQGVGEREGRNLRKFNFPHFHSMACSLWKTASPLRAVRFLPCIFAYPRSPAAWFRSCGASSSACTSGSGCSRSASRARPPSSSAPSS